MSALGIFIISWLITSHEPLVRDVYSSYRWLIYPAKFCCMASPNDILVFDNSEKKRFCVSGRHATRNFIPIDILHPCGLSIFYASVRRYHRPIGDVISFFNGWDIGNRFDHNQGRSSPLNESWRSTIIVDRIFDIGQMGLMATQCYPGKKIVDCNMRPLQLNQCSLSDCHASAGGSPHQCGENPQAGGGNKQRSGKSGGPPFGSRIPMALFFGLGSNAVMYFSLLDLDKRPVRGRILVSLAIIMMLLSGAIFMSLTIVDTWGWPL